jgi:uncharacterized membrane protein
MSIKRQPKSFKPDAKPSDLNKGHRKMRLPVALLTVFVALMGLMATSTPSKAELKLCNTTSSRVGVAIGYREKERWATEGWWNVAANTCEVLLKGKLIARFYYIHAVDYDKGGEWSGKDTMCTTDKAFTVFGVKDCVKRGYKRTGFFEIDTKNEHDWTVRLKYPDENGKK